MMKLLKIPILSLLLFLLFYCFGSMDGMAQSAEKQTTFKIDKVNNHYACNVPLSTRFKTSALDRGGEDYVTKIEEKYLSLDYVKSIDIDLSKQTVHLELDSSVSDKTLYSIIGDFNLDIRRKNYIHKQNN